MIVDSGQSNVLEAHRILMGNAKIGDGPFIEIDGRTIEVVAE